MTTLQKRLEVLEHRAEQEQERVHTIIFRCADQVGEVYKRLGAAWVEIDAGTFAGDEHHERALTTLREALPGIVKVNNGS